MKSKTYEKFVEKFKPKKTTDDCYTPPKVYEAVKDWAVKEYGLEGKEIVRPFYPGGDYENFDYSDNAVVIDNPPFSIFAKILDFYIDKGINFLLFVQHKTLFSKKAPMCYLVLGRKITYENGAQIGTSFVTNLEEPKIRTVPELYRIMGKGQNMTKYSYPKNIATIGKLEKVARAGVDFAIGENEYCFARKLDAQKGNQKIFGDGFLISDKKAEEMEKIIEKYERETTVKFDISDREKEIIKGLGVHSDNKI